MGYLPDALWDLWEGSIIGSFGKAIHVSSHGATILQLLKHNDINYGAKKT